MCLAVPLKLVEVSGDGALGMGRMGGSEIEVSLALVPEARPGDYVLVHAGMAIEIVDASEAEQTLALYREYVHDPDSFAPEEGHGQG